MPRITVPTKEALPSTLRIRPPNEAVAKAFKGLSRESLISLALGWLAPSVVDNARPYLRTEDDDDDEGMGDDLPCRSIKEVREVYEDMRQHKGSKGDVVSRILSGDWRHGLTMYQLATADFAHFDEHQDNMKWNAYEIKPLQQPNKDAGEDEVLKVDKQSLKIPRFAPSTFLDNLQRQVMPDVKAHYHIYQPKAFPVSLLRIFVIDSPYNSEQALSAVNFDSSRTIYLAFPNGSPSIYITKSQATGPIGRGESKSLVSLILDGVPKALSRPRERFRVDDLKFGDKNLSALLEKRGPGRTNAAGGGWDIYAKDGKSPFDTRLPTPPGSESSESDQIRKRKMPLNQAQRDREWATKRAKGRFGNSGQIGDGKGIGRLEVVLRDPFPPADTVEESDEEEQPQSKAKRRKSKVDTALQQANQGEPDDAAPSAGWTPSVKVAFTGSHVFAGIRQLVEAGIIDAKTMPGWMTGEEKVTRGVVRSGRIQGHKGSGI